MTFFKSFNRKSKAAYETVSNKYNSVKDKIKAFWANTFEVTHTKRSKGVGICLLAATLILVLLRVDAFTSQTFSGKWLLLAFDLTCPFILGLSATYTVTFKSPKLNRIWHLAFLFVMPVLTLTMTECLNNVFVYNMTYGGFIGNYFTILIFYFLVYGLSGSLKAAYLSVTPLLYVLAMAHSYLIDFRGTPFIPMDLLSIYTAAGVATNYDYTPNYKVITALFIFIFILIIGIKTKTPKYSLLAKVISRSLTGAVSIIILIIFYGTNIFASLGLSPDFWNQSRGYKNYGFVLNFFGNTRYMTVPTPDGYSPDNVQEYVDSTNENSGDGSAVTQNSDAPNIICIMNESLSDLSVLGDFKTNKEYMPFLNSLKKNTIKGNLYVPVIGAGTSNTEFEFLTGHSTAFLPSGSNAYMLYVKNHIASLVSTVEAQGYSSYALHPYYADGWRRTEVYGNFGFNSFTSLEDILTPDLIKEFRQTTNEPDYLQSLIDEEYPENDDMLIRQYISDSYNYKLLIENFENRDKSKPYFAFNVTMQNHGGYTTSAENFKESIYVKGTKNNPDYTKTNKYLSLVKYSDNAFKELVSYFENVDEPTIICMFGDHQPSIEKEFIAETLGVKNLLNLTTEQNQQRYCTPFYIWANYDIEEKYVDKLSANYLSSLVLKTAGVELTEYNKYLLNLAKTLPVIDNAGYIDSEGNYYKWSDSSPYTELLNEYEKVQYNNIFDRENVNRDVFYISGYVAPEEIEEEQ